MTSARFLIIIIFSSVFGAETIFAQNNIPVLTWRSHLSYNNIVDISSSGENLYVAAENALFYIDQIDFSINKITKADGLSDVEIGAIYYEEASDLLIVGYANGNIDLIYENKLINISTFQEAPLVGEKRFYDIAVHNEIIYLSNDQGILVLDPNREEIIESYLNLNAEGKILPVLAVAFSTDSIYAATAEGIISASLASNINRQDFNNWHRDLTDLSFSGLITTGNELTASSVNNLYSFNGTDWSRINLNLADTIRDINFYANNLYLLTDSKIGILNSNQVETITSIESSSKSTKLIKNAAEYWYGKSETGLNNFNNGRFQKFSPKGPSSDKVWRLYSIDASIFNIAGGYSSIYGSLNRKGYLSKFSNEDWSIDLIAPNEIVIPDIVDLDILENSIFQSDFFAASFQEGLINVAASKSVIDETSPGSTLERINGSINMTSIASEGASIWMSTYGLDESIHNWNVESDNWQAYSFGFNQSKYPKNILVLRNGDKWVSLDGNRGGGILVFNETNGMSRYLNTNGGQGGLPGRNVTAMVFDKDDFLWVGTNAGIAFYPNPFNVLDGNSLSASIPIFENRFLLRDESITSIAIDPGNRKWIGSATNGIWLFSESGESLIYHFTAENSPLLSNEIKSIEIEAQTGEVFIGSSAGLVSFQSEAIGNEPSHSNVKVFPNPISRNFTGVITITGLVNSAFIKITDVSGKLVKELKAQGSSAIWDARDYNGKRVKAGVYLVFSSNADGTETYVSKIAVI